MPSLSPDKISIAAFNQVLSRYAATAPSALAELDIFRYETAPSSLTAMKGEKQLIKSEVEKLVEWKLKHGTFRPSLMKLVRDNSAESIKNITSSAFAGCSSSSEKDVLRALTTLTQLRGIGPATASLLLSVLDPDGIPFFSDELFRWMCWGEKGDGKDDGWDRKIKYNVKEYKDVVERVGQIRKRLGVRAVDVEKVAYVLGMERANVDEDAERVEKETTKEKASEDTSERGRLEEIVKAIRTQEVEIEKGKKGQGEPAGSKEEDETKEAAKTSTKRKAKDVKLPTEGTRRSTRRKL
ncbi:hypothetical protein E8E13_007414 [Curvularia kusanoi]|uniref:Uncharacterized protein n=1 Tax=Curvularia kusanoi TaxID=90978 RepID=A0A9P4TLJ6_CURKU|nr:hypothetical protein E8E13_007414 [Curvularia kusanoi]